MPGGLIDGDGLNSGDDTQQGQAGFQLFCIVVLFKGAYLQQVRVRAGWCGAGLGLTGFIRLRSGILFGDSDFHLRQYREEIVVGFFLFCNSGRNAIRDCRFRPLRG